MSEFYRDFLALTKRSKILFYLLLLLSVPYKIFFLLYQTTTSGPDCAEYIYLSKLFEQNAIIGYIQSNDPFTLWRTPTLPFLLYITHTLTVYYILQLLFSYFLAYNFYKIFKFITNNITVAFFCFFTIIFLTYINNAACATLTEFLQISLFIYSFRKILFKQYDWRLIAALSAFCLLRAEAQYFVYFLIIRELFCKNYKKLSVYIIPLVFVLLWCSRNKSNFGTFSLVNPILSSRALIGNLYGFIYTTDRSEFHTNYDYFDGRDYVNKIEFIDNYKKVVISEIVNKLKHEPFDYLKIRAYQITHAFLYFGFNLERLPDKYWKYLKNPSFYEISKTNRTWSYSNIIKNKDYTKLILRLFYNGGLGLMHLFGLSFIFINCRKLFPLFFILLNFSFIFIVEVDMRYLITIQSVCFCASIVLFYSILKYRTVRLDWIKK